MDFQQLLYLTLLGMTTILLYLLPFAPALIEWKTKADSEPFEINFQDRSIVEYCIRIFREYIELNFASLLNEYSNSGNDLEGKHSNGIEYYISGKKGLIEIWGPMLTEQKIASFIVSAKTTSPTSSDVPRLLDPADEPRDVGGRGLAETMNQAQKITKVILLCNQATFPDNVCFVSKVYAKQRIETGINNVFNEVIADDEVHLKKGAVVNKLLYCGKSLTAHGPCILNGYAKAEHQICLTTYTEFQYLHAPVITFGTILTEPPTYTFDVFGKEIKRTIAQETLVIPAQSSLETHIVAKKSLVFENHCTISGNIKGHQDIRIEPNCRIFGAIIGEKDIFIADDCFIQGPIVAGGGITLGKNCIIGAQNTLTSLIAQTLIIANGCRVAGLVLAKQEGIFR